MYSQRQQPYYLCHYAVTLCKIWLIQVIQPPRDEWFLNGRFCTRNPVFMLMIMHGSGRALSIAVIGWKKCRGTSLTQRQR